MSQPSTTKLADQLAELIVAPDFEDAVERHPGPYHELIAAVVKEHGLEPNDADLEGLCARCQKQALAYSENCTLELRANALAAYQLGLSIGRREDFAARPHGRHGLLTT